MMYLLVGQDHAKKTLKIEELKKKILKDPGAYSFDFEILYAHKLEPQVLKKALVALPAIAPARLILIKESQKLSPANKDLITAFAKDPGSSTVILDANDMESDDPFLKKLGKSAKIEVFETERELNVFDMTREISRGKAEEALRILSRLLSQGDQPLAVMGGLVWFWKNARREFSPGTYQKGLLVLQEADLNIKRSRLNPQHALEMAVVKLCSKEAG